MGKCKLCGAPGSACGGPSSVAPADHKIREGDIVSDELKRYNVTVGNRRGSSETVMVLDEAGAKARGLTEKDLWKPTKSEKPQTQPRAPRAQGKPRAKRAAAPKNKQAAPAADKGGAPVSAPAKPADE